MYLHSTLLVQYPFYFSHNIKVKLLVNLMAKTQEIYSLVELQIEFFSDTLLRNAILFIYKHTNKNMAFITI